MNITRNPQKEILWNGLQDLKGLEDELKAKRLPMLLEQEALAVWLELNRKVTKMQKLR